MTDTRVSPLLLVVMMSFLMGHAEALDQGRQELPWYCQRDLSLGSPSSARRG